MNSITKTIIRSPSESVEIPDLDVTPIMNMFIILIPFLVSMAVFTQLSILEFNLPSNAGTGLDGSNGKPKLKITVVVANDHLAITHGERMLDSIPVVNQNYDLITFRKNLSRCRHGVSIQDEAIVAVRDNVKFKHVVHIMDECKSAGFAKIGLSNATKDARTGV